MRLVATNGGHIMHVDTSRMAYNLSGIRPVKESTAKVA